MSNYVQIDPEQLKELRKETYSIKAPSTNTILVVMQIITLVLVLYLFFSGNGARRNDPIEPIIPVTKVEDVAEASLRIYITKKADVTRQLGQMIADGKITSKAQLRDTARPAQNNAYIESNRELDKLDEATMPPTRDSQGNIVGDYDIPGNKDKLKDYFFRKADGYERLLKGR
jgi:hypothetical protein